MQMRKTWRPRVTSSNPGAVLRVHHADREPRPRRLRGLVTAESTGALLHESEEDAAVRRRHLRMSWQGGLGWIRGAIAQMPGLEKRIPRAPGFPVHRSHDSPARSRI